MKWPAYALASLALAGCSTDVCDVSISDLEGEWELTWTDDGDRINLVIEIDGEGNVNYRDSDGGRADCEIENEIVCEAKVDCTKPNGDVISFDLERDE
jgi:hypothetical protein